MLSVFPVFFSYLKIVEGWGVRREGRRDAAVRLRPRQSSRRRIATRLSEVQCFHYQKGLSTQRSRFFSDYNRN